MPPGWRPDDVAVRFPHPPFDVHRMIYNPPASRLALAVATVLFLAIAAGSGVLLWDAETMDAGPRALWVALLIAGLCVVGELLDGNRLGSTGWFGRGGRKDEPAG
jgi:hypothetical protein